MLLACCLILQGLLAGVLPFQFGMVLAAEVEHVEAAPEESVSAPPCHSAAAAPRQHAVAQSQDQESEPPCCDSEDTHCSSLCYWACAYTSAPPLASAGELAGPLGSGLVSLAIITNPPWVPPIPTPPPIAI